MGSHAKIVNLSNGHRIKHSRAIRLIDQCAAVWAVPHVSIRNLTVSEMVKARSEQAKLQEPLPYAEVHGLRYDPSMNGVEASRRERGLIWEAHDFLRSVAA